MPHPRTRKTPIRLPWIRSLKENLIQRNLKLALRTCSQCLMDSMNQTLSTWLLIKTTSSNVSRPTASSVSKQRRRSDVPSRSKLHSKNKDLIRSRKKPLRSLKLSTQDLPASNRFRRLKLNCLMELCQILWRFKNLSQLRMLQKRSLKLVKLMGMPR